MPEQTTTPGPEDSTASNSTRLLDAISLDDAVNSVCRHLPDGYEIDLCMENGSAWVTLWRIHVEGCGVIDLPDSDDKSLIQQLNDALCVANGWSI
jgi:hypothetical protein